MDEEAKKYLQIGQESNGEIEAADTTNSFNSTEPDINLQQGYLNPNYVPNPVEPKKTNIIEGYKNFRKKAGDILGVGTGFLLDPAVYGATQLANLTGDLFKGTNNFMKESNVKKAQDITQDISGDIAYSAGEAYLLSKVLPSAAPALAQAGMGAGAVKAVQLASKGLKLAKGGLDTAVDVDSLVSSVKNKDTVGAITSAGMLALDLFGIGTDVKNTIFKKSGDIDFSTFKKGVDGAPSTYKTLGETKGVKKITKTIGTTKTTTKNALNDIDYAEANVNRLKNNIVKYADPDTLTNNPLEDDLKASVQDLLTSVKNKDGKALAYVQEVYRKEGNLVNEQLQNTLSSSRFAKVSKKDYDSIINEVSKKMSNVQTSPNEVKQIIKQYTKNAKLGEEISPKKLWDMSQFAYDVGGNSTHGDIMSEFNVRLKEALFDKVPELQKQATDLYSIGASINNITSKKAKSMLLGKLSAEFTNPIQARSVRSEQNFAQSLSQLLTGSSQTKMIKSGISDILTGTGKKVDVPSLVSDIAKSTSISTNKKTQD